MAPTRVILMSCGSFNPPTIMHLRMFEIARDHLHKMGTHVVVGGVICPVHDDYKKKGLENAQHRCTMLKLALQNTDWIHLSTWETEQNGWSRTVVCLQHHQDLLNAVIFQDDNRKNYVAGQDVDWIPENVRNSSDKSPIQIKLLCGADFLESFKIFNLWLDEDIDTICSQFGLVVISRDDSNPNKCIYDLDILTKNMRNIIVAMEWISNEISSTKMRKALRQGRSIRYFVQDAVVNYIYENGLYEATPSIKLELSSPNFNKYLTIDKYQLTPSPTSDVTMSTPSPVIEKFNIDLPDAVFRKNVQNNVSGSSTGSSSADLEIARERFISSLTENNCKQLTSTSKTYPGLAKQIIANETGESRIVDEVGHARVPRDFDNDELLYKVDDSDNSSVYDIETRLKAMLDSVESRINKTELPVRSSYTKLDDDRFSISEPTIPEPPNLEETKDPNLIEKQEEISCITLMSNEKSDYEIDGKYLKSLVNSRKSPKKIKGGFISIIDDEGDTVRSIYKERINRAKSEEMLRTQKLSRIKSTKETKHKSRREKSQSESRSEESILNVVAKKSKSYESVEKSESITAKDLEGEEICTICCYMNETTNTLKSNCSSEVDEDSTECDICSSWNLLDTSEVQLSTAVNEEQTVCEICEICGDVDEKFEEEEEEEVVVVVKTSPTKSEEDQFEIENCGFDGKEKLDVCLTKDICFVPKDEIAIFSSGCRKMNRKGSSLKKKMDEASSGPRQRRYSSADNLEGRKIVGSADNIRVMRNSRRCKSLQRSVDNLENLDSLKENVVKEEDRDDQCDNVKVRDNEALKMLLTQHGIKIISQTETAL